jgi:hypothetical protein
MKELAAEHSCTRGPALLLGAEEPGEEASDAVGEAAGGALRSGDVLSERRAVVRVSREPPEGSTSSSPDRGHWQIV